jgi:uncharacterized protein (TIGR00297 family)
MSTMEILAIVIGTMCFGWLTYRRKMLSADGSIAAMLMGLWVLYFSGWLWIAALFFFFLSGTLWGKILRPVAEVADPKADQARDWRQVFCNGGIFALLSPGLYSCYASEVAQLMALSLSISTADTWASEIGVYFGGKTYDLRTWDRVPKGLSGGVSAAGTIAALAGALSMGTVAFGAAAGAYTWQQGLLLVAGGFAGMLLDSYLGATLQARYQNEQGQWQERPRTGWNLVSGRSWIDNDLVNFFSNLIVCMLYGLVLGLLEIW